MLYPFMVDAERTIRFSETTFWKIRLDIAQCSFTLCEFDSIQVAL